MAGLYRAGRTASRRLGAGGQVRQDWLRAGNLAPVPPESEISRRWPDAELERRLAERDALIAQQAQRIAELEALVAELRARLDQNSRSSSKPPSSDGYAKESVEKNKKPSLRRRSGRKPGGQPGHRGHHLERREDPERTELHELKVCECCGRDLSAASIEQSQSRQVFDLSEMPALECVEHWIQMRRCECGHLTGSSFPAGVSAPVCYGPRIRALGIYLVSYQHLPYERAAEILTGWAGAPISAATLQAFVAQGAEGLEEFLEEVRSQLTLAEVAHFEETGGRIDGRLGWIHSASTDTLTLLTAHRKRGVEAMIAAGVLGEFRGVAVRQLGSVSQLRRCVARAVRRPSSARADRRVGAGAGVGAGHGLPFVGHQGRRRAVQGRRTQAAVAEGALRASRLIQGGHQARLRGEPRARHPDRRAAAEADQGAEPADPLGPARDRGAAVRARFQGAVRCASPAVRASLKPHVSARSSLSADRRPLLADGRLSGSA
jgi:transposase